MDLLISLTHSLTLLPCFLACLLPYFTIVLIYLLTYLLPCLKYCALACNVHFTCNLHDLLSMHVQVSMYMHVSCNMHELWMFSHACNMHINAQLSKEDMHLICMLFVVAMVTTISTLLCVESLTTWGTPTTCRRLYTQHL